MIAEKEYLVNSLIGTDRRQFIIPIYQRKYKWTNEQCSRLIDDIVKSGKKRTEHFTGTVVITQQGGSFRKAYLVDGQQRVTTIVLIVKALSLICEEREEDKDYEYVYKSTHKCLYADQNDFERGYKVIPSKNDRKTFNLIMRAKSLKEIEDNPIIAKDKEDLMYNNFKYVYQRIFEMLDQGLHVREELYEGLLNLTVVGMTLEHRDDPQEIFESINSLGVSLSNADLIRNYLLMSNENQSVLYEKYWEPIQDSLIGENNMESFVNDYLLMKKSYSINYGDIYKEYVEFANSIGDGIDNRDELLKDLYEVAQIYQPFLRISDSYNPETNMLMQELRDMGQTTAYPFLMKVFLDKQSGLITEERLQKVINLIIVYLVRRTICKVPTNSLRGFMLNLYNRIFDKVPENKSKYYESIHAFFINLNTRDGLLSSEEAKKNLVTFPLYKNVKFASYVLYRIENSRYPNPYSEYVTAKSITVEHIMPQNLTDEWISDLGENAVQIHETYINTLGNLSLSSRARNSSMSDETFAEKKKVLLSDDSKFDVLNRSLKNLDKFTKQDILNREAELSKILISKYEIERADTTGIRFDDVIEIICDYEYNPIFLGTRLVSFRLFGIETNVNEYSRMLSQIVRTLLKKYPEKIRSLAAEGYTPWNGETVYLQYSDNASYLDVGEGIRINTGLSSPNIVDFAVKLLSACGIAPEELTIIVNKDTVNKKNFLKKSEKIKIIRTALERLGKEGVLIYDYQKMPKGDAAIKFQTQTLNNVFNTKNYNTSWDNEKFPDICYCEMFLKDEKVVITVKKINATTHIIQKLESLKEELSIENPIMSGYWQIKSYPIDLTTVLNGENASINLATSILEIVVLINSFMEQLNSRISFIE